MKRIRNVLCLLLAIMMTLTMAACGNSTTADKSGGESIDQQTASETADTAKTEETESIQAAEGVTRTEGENGRVTLTTASDPSFSRKTKEGTLTVGTLTNDADSLDPALTDGLGCFAVFDQLFRVDEDGSIVGELVEQWEYLDEEKTQLQLKLYEGILFSNGEEMNAEDILYSLDRFDDVGSAYTYWAGIDFEQSYTVDDYTVVLVIPEPNVSLLAYMTTFRASIVSKDWAENAEDADWWKDAVGSGPYICTENTSGSQSVFTAREDYWLGAPEYETITIKYYTEQTTMMIDFENGALDCCYDLNAGNITRVQNNEVSNSTLVLDPNPQTWVLFLPQKKADTPMNNELFRKAFIEAIDMEGIGIAVAGDLASVADTFITAASNMDTDDCFNHVYDPKQAKADLAAAGYEPGEVTLTVTIPGASGYAELAETIQAYESEIGINVEITSADIPTVVDHLQNCTDDFLINTVTDIIGDPDGYYDFNADTSTALQASYSDEVFNANCLAARKTADTEERAALYSEAWQSLYDQYYVIPCFNVYYGVLSRDYIDSAIMSSYDYIDVTRVTSK